MKGILFACLFIFQSLASFCQYEYQKPGSLNDGWQTAHLSGVAIDSVLIHKFLNQLSGQKHQLHSILLIRNEKLVLEEYFGEYNINKPHDFRSVTKSIASILMGIAIDKGFVHSVDDPVSKYIDFPESDKNPDIRKSQITIRHLLTMSTGLDCNDWDKKSKGQEDKVYKKKDLIYYTLSLPMIRDSGSQSYYCTMGVVIAKKIIENASGLRLDQFAKKYLFEPLGITDYSWDHTTTNREMILASKRLYMKPRDLAKIGLLVMKKGRWNDQVIVSESWIKEMSTPQTKITGLDYGFLWWSLTLQSEGKVMNALTATGNGGQYIIIIEEFNLMAVFTGGAYNSDQDKLPFAVMNKVVLPSTN